MSDEKKVLGALRGQPKYDGYLTEKKALDFFSLVFDCSCQTKVGKMKVDFSFSFKGKKYFFEFNGYRHYNSAVNQQRDLFLESYCSLNDIILIKWPYFIQLTSDSVYGLMGEDVHQHLLEMYGENWKPSEYPHGFIDPKALRPCDFNMFGYALFVKQYSDLVKDDITMNIARDIYDSLNTANHFTSIGVSAKIHPEMMPGNFLNHYPT